MQDSKTRAAQPRPLLKEGVKRTFYGQADHKGGGGVQSLKSSSANSVPGGPKTYGRTKKLVHTSDVFRTCRNLCAYWEDQMGPKSALGGQNLI